MIFNDNDKHHKPHVHVYYGECEASEDFHFVSNRFELANTEGVQDNLKM